MSAAAATADASATAKPKSKKLLFILIGVVVLALAAAGGAFFLLKKNAADEEDGGDGTEVVEKHADKHKTPPTFLPLENMVVNLADAGGNRFVQLGITLQLEDAKTGEDVKTYMPSIRNGVLLLISQRTADEILQVSGKEKLANDIIAEISRLMDYEIEDPEAEETTGKKKRRQAPPNPVQGVLFSSFIVQ